MKRWENVYLEGREIVYLESCGARNPGVRGCARARDEEISEER